MRLSSARRMRTRRWGASTSRRRSRSRACGLQSAPARRTGLRRKRASRARPSPLSPPTASPRRARRSRRSRSSGRSSRSCSIRTRQSGAGSSRPKCAATSEATSTGLSSRPTWSSMGRTGRRPSSITRSKRTRPSASGRATRSTSTSRHNSSGASGRTSPRRLACPRTRCASSASSWAAASAPRTAPTRTLSSPRSSRG